MDTIVPSSSTSPVTPPLFASPQKAVELLRDGKLVLLPTETVYGIAMNLQSPESLRRLEAIKPGIRPMVLHLPAPETLLRMLPDMPMLAKRFIRRAWPGPVAVRLTLSAKNIQQLTEHLSSFAVRQLFNEHENPAYPAAIFRCPDHPFTQDVLLAAQFPIALVGASSGSSAATELSAISPKFTENLDAIVDTGPTRYKKASTLVQIDHDRLRVVRPGAIDERIIDRLAEYLILFVCSGNTCRSPMAAAITEKLLAEKLGISPDHLAAHRIHIASAGLYASHGMRATPEAVDAAAQLGADLSGHNSQPVTSDLLRRADVIYTMTQSHRDGIVEFFPEAKKKTQRLDAAGDIEDPIGQDVSVYLEVAGHLQDVIKRRLSELPA